MSRYPGVYRNCRVPSPGVRLCSEPGPKPSSVPIELRWLAKQVRPLVHLHLASFLCLTAASLLGLLAPLVLKWLIDQIIPQKQTGLLALAVGLIFLSFQGKTALAGLGNYLLLSAAQRTALSLRMRLLRHLDTLSSDYYEDTPVGAVMYPLKEPVEEIASFGSDLLPAILRSLLITCFTVAAMFALSPPLTMSILPLVPAFLLGRQRFRPRLSLDSDIVQRDRLACSEFLEEHLASVIPVQLLGQQKRQERRGFQRMARSVRSQQKLFRSGAWFTAGSSFAVVLSMCAVIGYGGLRVLAGGLSVGSLVAFYSFVTQLFEPLSGVAELYARAQKAFASIRQVQATLVLRPSIQNARNATPSLRGYPPRIEFNRVEFGYPRRKNTLSIPSLRISSGEMVAIVGENGAGKSSLAKLVARIYDVDCGSVSVGGEDIRCFELGALHRFVCYLPRDPILFNGSLASNLRFVRPGVSQRELEAVIRLVGMSSSVAKFPDGLCQRIGPGACQLSGGQRQRLAIARALLQEPRILILDEATSCLDSVSELRLLRVLRQALPASTFIIVSHRVSTLSGCNRVVSLGDGHIIGDGHPGSLFRLLR